MESKLSQARWNARRVRESCRVYAAALAVVVLLVAPAHAQKTKAALVSEVDINWPDNTVGLITPALLRTTVIDIINSYFDFGGASSFACPTNQWITQYVSLADNIICAQPSLSSLSNYQQNEVSNVDLAIVPAWTFKGNPTAGIATPADFTIPSLTQKTTPVNADLLIIADSAASNAFKKVPWGSIPGVSGAVTSLNGLTGAVSIIPGNAITVTPSGSSITISVAMAEFTNALGSDVAMNNTSNYFDGPTVAQGATGTWFASGNVVVGDTAASAIMTCKLWDGTTVIESSTINAVGNNGWAPIHLSGYLASPAGNIRISCNDGSATTGHIYFNKSALSKDSTISVFRIN